MPVRSLRSSVLRWPDGSEVARAVRLWGARLLEQDPRVLRVGYCGSYARGDWGVGSDVDLVVLASPVEERCERRAPAYPAEELPVPADVFVYSPQEWEAMLRRGGFARTVAGELVWVAAREGNAPAQAFPHSPLTAPVTRPRTKKRWPKR